MGRQQRIQWQYTRAGYFDPTEDFVSAVEDNPVLEGWGNKIVVIREGKVDGVWFMLSRHEQKCKMGMGICVDTASEQVYSNCNDTVSEFC